MMTTIPVSAQVDQETANKQLDQAMKALESGDNAAAEGYMKEANKTLSEGEAKTHLDEAIKGFKSWRH
jgi:cellobiose-specific phosphotransferase system component IIA